MNSSRKKQVLTVLNHIYWVLVSALSIASLVCDLIVACDRWRNGLSRLSDRIACYQTASRTNQIAPVYYPPQSVKAILLILQDNTGWLDHCIRRGNRTARKGLNRVLPSARRDFRVVWSWTSFGIFLCWTYTKISSDITNYHCYSSQRRRRRRRRSSLLFVVR